MLNRFADELIAAISAARTDFPVMPAIKGNGHDVGVAVVELMRRSAKRLPPLRIIEVFASQPGGRARTEAMWNALGKKTAVLILDGATTLAGIWDRAWKLGRGGGGNPALPARAFSQRSLQDLYVKDSFLKSSKLQQLTRAGDKIVPI